MKFRKIKRKSHHRQFKILSIDGGGIRGYFAAYIIYKLKEEFNIDILKEFDMFVGTSVGGSIVMGILEDIDWKEYIENFKEHSNVFTEKHPLKTRLSIPFYPKYTNTKLIADYKRLFGNRTPSTKHNKHWIITSTNFTEGKPVLFASKSFTHSSFKGENLKIIDMLRATTAAPSYFEPFKIDTTLLLDGGLWANNPTGVAIDMAQSDLNIPLKDISVFSIGFRRTDQNNFNVKKFKEILSNPISSEFLQIVSSLIDVNQNYSNFISNRALKDRCLRIYPRSTEDNGKIDVLTDEFINDAKMTWELLKDKIVDFIKNGKISDYNDFSEKIYN